MLQADSIQAVLVLDNGTGAINGQAPRDALTSGIVARPAGAVAKLGADSVRDAAKTEPTT
jgi:hypothetical protein